MTEENRHLLYFIVNRKIEHELDRALSWATLYQVKFLRSKSPYVLASLVYLNETAMGRPNDIGKALCSSFEKFNQDEAQKVLDNFRFPASEMYNIVNEWKKFGEIPITFNILQFTKAYEILHAAAFKDDVDTINWLISRDVNIDEKDTSGKAALHVAAANGKMRSARCLITAGASLFSIDYFYETPIESALRHFEFAVVELFKPDQFCNLRIFDGETLLMKLIRGGFIHQVKYLLRYANLEVVNQANQNLLHVCALSGQAKIMKIILQLGVPPAMINAVDSFYQTPLYLAMRHNKATVTRLLLTFGAMIIPDDGQSRNS